MHIVPTIYADVPLLLTQSLGTARELSDLWHCFVSIMFTLIGLMERVRDRWEVISFLAFSCF